MNRSELLAGVNNLGADATAAALAQRLDHVPDWEGLGDLSSGQLAVLFATRLVGPVRRQTILERGVVSRGALPPAVAVLRSEGLVAEHDAKGRSTSYIVYDPHRQDPPGAEMVLASPWVES